MPKRIQVSIDSGVTWLTLPGNTGEIQHEAGSLDDTIFGQAFASSEAGLIGWNLQSNAYYKGFAGYNCDIKKPGTSTAMTTEACSLVSGKTYQINDATKRAMDRTAVTNVFVGGVNQNANVLSIDWLHGRVTFLPAYTVSGAVTITGKYFPMVMLAGYRNFTLTCNLDPIEDSDIPSVQANGGIRTFTTLDALKNVSLELNGVYKPANNFRTDLYARTELIIDFTPEGTGATEARGFFKYSGNGSSGELGALEEETVSMKLYVPDNALMETPFSWIFYPASSNLSLVIRNVYNAWYAGTTVKVRYLPDGTTGVQGDAIVTEVSLGGGLDAMSEFSIQFQGTGALTDV